MAKVLVTGANGFVGSHLVRALAARGDDVTCLVRKTSKLDRLEPLGARTAYGDVTDAESLADPVADKSVVYHVAGCVAALGKEQFYRVNAQGTENVAGACARLSDPPVLVVVSSLAAAGPAPRGRLRTESDPPRPVSHYGRSKRAGEKAAERYADRVPITVVRPPTIFGEADKSAFPWFYSVERLGVHLAPCWMPQRLSIIHADDLIALLILAAQRGTRLAPVEPETESTGTGGYYFASGNEHPTHYRLGRMIGKAFGRRRTLVISFPAPAVWLVAGTGELIGQIRRQPVFLGIDKAREATAGSWTCSAQTAVDELGFRVGASLTERLEQTARWYREQGWL